MYRIISGQFRGRKIIAPKNFSVRPTTDFAKEALFGILTHKVDISSVEFLDLFAGIGSISFEMASRRAKAITLVENNTAHYNFIKKTIEVLDIAHLMTTIKSDVFQFLKRPPQSYNLIFADPPFNFEIEQYTQMIELLFQNKFLKDNGLIILEHSNKLALKDLPNYAETRTYGAISFSFFQ